MPPLDGTIIVNAGDQIDQWTNGHFQSANHRVLTVSDHARYSCDTTARNYAVFVIASPRALERRSPHRIFRHAVCIRPAMLCAAIMRRPADRTVRRAATAAYDLISSDVGMDEIGTPLSPRSRKLPQQTKRATTRPRTAPTQLPHLALHSRALSRHAQRPV